METRVYKPFEVLRLVHPRFGGESAVDTRLLQQAFAALTFF